MAEQSSSISTQAIHAGEWRPRIEGAVSMPVFQSSTFEYRGEQSYDALKYIRMNNTPNHEVLHAKLAALEAGEAALVCASGMAAISTALLSVLQAGDHLLAQDCLYGGTHDFITQDLEKLGISYDFIDGDKPETWAAALKDNTRAIYCESMTNPLLQVADLQAVVDFARKHELVSLIDNTFTTPFNFQPLTTGFDLSLHSATKYLNGHTDIVGGVVAGSEEHIAAVGHKLLHLGACLDPHACSLLHRGLKTLAIRMERHNSNALAIARFLDEHPVVETVNYPGLESHPRYKRAENLFRGFSGMLSFELRGGLAASNAFMENLHLFIVAPSLGGVESLATFPALTSHAGLSPEKRRQAGITDSLVRLSIGIEDVGDLKADLENALRASSGA